MARPDLTFWRTRARLVPGLVLVPGLALAPGCFQPDEPSADDEVGVTETDTGDDTDTGTGTDTDTTTDTDTDTTTGIPNEPPTIDSFTLGGDAADLSVDVAGAVLIAVEASDPDGSVAEIQILRDGEVFATVPGPGPASAEFVIGGEAFDGDYVFSALAVDDGGLEGSSDPLTLTVDVPLGGQVELWTADFGDNDASYRIAINPDGTEVLIGGYETLDSGVSGRMDRVVGAPWAQQQLSEVYSVGGFGLLGDGRLVTSGWSIDDGASSVLYDFNSAGLQNDLIQGDWTSPGTPPANFEAPLDIAVDADGNFYVVGVFTGAMGSSPDTTYMFKFNEAGDLLWQFHSDLADGLGQPVYANGIEVRGDEVVIAGQARTPNMGGTANEMWLGRFDTAGNFMAETIIEGGEGTAWGVALDEGGEVLVGGMRFSEPSYEAFLGRFGPNGQPLWTKQGGHTGIGSVLATGVDPWGNSLALVAEDCETGFLAIVGCDIYVRKYTSGGELLWEEAYESDDFSGPSIVPVVGDLDIDRFGYVYATVPQSNESLDWWAVKLHP